MPAGTSARRCLLEHVSSNAISLAWAAVCGGFAVLEDLQGPVLRRVRIRWKPRNTQMEGQRTGSR